MEFDAEDNIVIIYHFWCSGIPWCGEFVSHFILHQTGPDSDFKTRLTIDILNLFSVSQKKVVSALLAIPGLKK